MENLPHVSALKVLKNAGRILENPLPFHQENFDRLGDTFRISIPGDTQAFFSRNPEVVKQILQKKHRYYSKSKLQTKDLAKYIGKGLLTAEGDHWRTHRKMIQPAFHLKNLKNLLSIMHRAVIDELARIAPNEEQDVFELMGDLAFQVVAKSLFSSSDIREPMAKLKQITEENQTMLIREMRQPYFKWWFNATGQISRELDKAQEARDILNDLVEERLRTDQKSTDLLDMLLESEYEDGSKMPRKQLIDELLILFAAGHETTANALSFTLYFIARDPELQDRLFQEINAVNMEGFAMESLKQLPLVKSCLNEAMRLYPPAYFIDRKALEDNEIDGMTIKKGTVVLLSMYELHRHKGCWERPNEYVADRFVDLEPKAYASYYYPFGAGPRMCIGNAFATYEMAMAIMELVKRYTITPLTKEIAINPMISLKPKEVRLSFSKR